MKLVDNVVVVVFSLGGLLMACLGIYFCTLPIPGAMHMLVGAGFLAVAVRLLYTLVVVFRECK
jgi:hypothetical protein